MVEKVDVRMLWTVLHNLEHWEVPYLWGGKAPSLSCDTSQCRKGLDCSGFTQYDLAKSTGQKLLLPDGSADQHAWCEAQGLHKVRYADAINPAYFAGRLFIAFLQPRPTGHAWLVYEGATLESFGHHGPGSRDASLPMFRSIADACYELPVAA